MLPSRYKHGMNNELGMNRRWQQVLVWVSSRRPDKCTSRSRRKKVRGSKLRPEGASNMRALSHPLSTLQKPTTRLGLRQLSLVGFSFFLPKGLAWLAMAVWVAS